MVDLETVLEQLDEHDGTSVEKLTDILAAVRYIDPGDEKTAQMLAVFNMLAPTVLPLLPQDPDELDSLLEAGARLFVALRSADAEPELQLVADVATEPARVHTLGEMGEAPQ